MHKETQEGMLYIVSGPSGSGKTTLAKGLLGKLDRISFAVSCTTRHPRNGEVDGQDYRFVSDTEFDEMVTQGVFAEWAIVHGNRYGTPKSEIDSPIASGVDVLLDLDVQGARAIHREYNDAVLIFVVPPSIEELKKRLIRRMSNEIDEIDARLKVAKSELEDMERYDYIITNTDIDSALVNLESIIRANRCRTSRVIAVACEHLVEKDND